MYVVSETSWRRSTVGWESGSEQACLLMHDFSCVSNTTHSNASNLRDGTLAFVAILISTRTFPPKQAALAGSSAASERERERERLS